MALLTHVRPHPDALVDLLCEELSRPPADVFTPEVVSVPTRGIERWLTQEIAQRLSTRTASDGICANIEFPAPARLVRRALHAVPALEAAIDAWEGPRMVAHVLTVIDAHVDEPWMWLLAHHLETPGREASPRRLAAATKISRLFSSYARHRPAMVRSWHDGMDVGPDGGPLGEDWLWQPRLWRLLRAQIGIASLAELLPEGLDPIRQGSTELDLPDRLSVYGLTAIDPVDIEVLAAIGASRQVSLYVLHASPALWRTVEQAVESTPSPRLRASDPVAGLAVHPLLRAWGQDSRELHQLLAQRGLTGTTGPDPSEAPPPSLLSQLQADIRRNRTPQPSPNRSDRSVQFHVCHGPRRQAEVVRDAILHAMSADRSLEPRDVVIMTPDLATFAPLLEAAFPEGDVGGLPDLRLRIADRSPAATNPLVGLAVQLVTMLDSRLEADAVRRLVSLPQVQNRFGFDADTAGEVVQVIDDTRVAWGLDASDRTRWGVDGVDDRTWRRALDRALTGVFYSDSPTRVVGGIAPLAGVEGQDAIGVGLLGAILDRLAALRSWLGEGLPTTQWAAALGIAVRTLARPDWGDEWQLDQLDRLLGEIFPPAEADSEPSPRVSLAEVRAALSVWTDDRPSPLFFRTGDVTVCTLAPMRSVPYRIVCLLGMDDSRFPRRGRTDGDDLLTDHEMIGDYDPGAADRQLLLDAVMAAGDHLIITYSGHDQLTSATYPPAVPVAELMDTLAEMGANTEALVIDHPLQSFSARNFVAGELVDGKPWGFDPMQHLGAVALASRSSSTAAAPVTWPAVPPPQTLRLGELVAFLQDPPGRFLRNRLGFTVPRPGEMPNDNLPVDLAGLPLWSATSLLLDGQIAGHDAAELIDALRASDAVPPGRLGNDALAGAADTARRLWQAARDLDYQPERHRTWSGTVEVAGVRLEGTVAADPEQHRLATVTPSRLGSRPRLEAFARLAFLSALAPGTAWEAALLGRREKNDGLVFVRMVAFAGPDPAVRAVEALERLVGLYLAGSDRPLPLPSKTAYAWQRYSAGKGDDRARKEFTGKYGEAEAAAWRLVLPEITTWEGLMASSFAELAAELWLPILGLSREKPL